MENGTPPSEDLYVVGRVRPVYMRIPLRGKGNLSCRGQAQTSYAGKSLRLLCWPEQRLSPAQIVLGSRDCQLKLELCGTPLQVTGGIVNIIRRQKPLLLLKIRNYVFLDQKRRSFRAPIQTPVLCWLLGENGQALPPKTVARSINLSEGGLLVWSRDTWEVGRLLRLELDPGHGLSPLRCTARVLRSEKDATYGMTALAWEDLSQGQEDAIVDLCYAKQREEMNNLRKGAEEARKDL